MEKIVSLVDDPHEVSFASMTNAARDAITQRVASHYGVNVASLTSAHWRTTHSTAIRGLGCGDRIVHSDSAEYRKQAEAATGICWDTIQKPIQFWNLARMSGRSLRSVVDEQRRIHPDVQHYQAVLGVIKRYEQGKQAEGWMDLIDPLLAFGGVRHSPDGFSEEVRYQGSVPDGVRLLVLDEAQDASYLIYRVQRRLEDECGPEHTILAADPYQSIFSFTGGDPRYFLEWPVDEEVVMERSWRCSADIFALGHRCLSGTAGYRDFGILPAEHPGSVHRETASRVRRAVEVAGSGTVMILARTHYRAEEIAGMVDEPTSEIGKNASRESLAFRAIHYLSAGGIVSAEDFSSVISILPAKETLERGAKAKWSRGEYGVSEVAPWQLRDLGVTQGGVEAIMSGRWRQMIKNPQSALAWKSRCDKAGPEAATNARIKYGTIHASKGLEADAVIVDDALPKATQTSIRIHRWAADEERRVSYVGVTRARRTCVVLEGSEPKWRRASWMR